MTEIPLEAGQAVAVLGTGRLMARADFAPEFPLEWALKDVDPAIAAADGTRPPLLEALPRQWRAAVEAGYGRDDIRAARLALGDHVPASDGSRESTRSNPVRVEG